MPKINFYKIRGKLFLIIWGVISSGYMVGNLVYTATYEWNLIHFEFCLYNVVTEKMRRQHKKKHFTVLKACVEPQISHFVNFTL